MTHITLTAEQWNQLLSGLLGLAIIAAVGFVALTADFWHWLDRIRWHRRRRARLARRRAKAVTHA